MDWTTFVKHNKKLIEMDYERMRLELALKEAEHTIYVCSVEDITHWERVRDMKIKLARYELEYHNLNTKKYIEDWDKAHPDKDYMDKCLNVIEIKKTTNEFFTE